MSSQAVHVLRETNFDRSFLKTHVTEELKKRKKRMESFAPKITQNDPGSVSFSKTPGHRGTKSFTEDFEHESKVVKTMNRRINENFTPKAWEQKNIYMQPCRWEPTGWRYPHLHNESPPSTREYMRARYVPYKDIAAEKLKKNYFKTSYKGQFQERIGFKNSNKKLKLKGSGFNDTDRLNEYVVEKGIPDHSTYISACYPPIPIGKKGVNDEYLKIKKYSPMYLMERRNTPMQNYPEQRDVVNHTTLHSPASEIDEEWFKKCKQDKRELYKRTISLERSVHPLSYGSSTTTMVTDKYL